MFDFCLPLPLPRPTPSTSSFSVFAACPPRAQFRVLSLPLSTPSTIMISASAAAHPTPFSALANANLEHQICQSSPLFREPAEQTPNTPHAIGSAPCAPRCKPHAARQHSCTRARTQVCVFTHVLPWWCVAALRRAASGHAACSVPPCAALRCAGSHSMPHPTQNTEHRRQHTKHETRITQRAGHIAQRAKRNA